MAEIKSDADLLAGIKLNSEKDFQEFFNRYYKKLVYSALSILSDQALAKDAAQEVFLQIWRNRHKLEIKSSVHGYLKRAVINKSLNRLKSQQRHTNKELLEIDKSTSGNALKELEAQDLESAISAALEEMPKRCRQIFCLKRFELLSHKEIADLLGISTKTIENQMTKALKILRNAIRPHAALKK